MLATVFFCGLCSLLIYLVARYLLEKIPLPDLSNRSVLITGCDTGFGYNLTLKLLRHGLTVFAGCLTEKGEEKLRKEAENLPGTLETLRLDVTKQESIDSALEVVKEKLGAKGLWALVNNAGIASNCAPDDWLNLEDYRRTLDVNFFGPVGMTHAFKPLLKAGKGRIIMMVSIFGRNFSQYMGPYTASKHALIGYSSCLRIELREFEVSVITIEPGMVRHGITDQTLIDKAIEEQWTKTSPATKAEYGEPYKAQLMAFSKKMVDFFASDDVDWVIDAYYHAITGRFPRYVYMCGWVSGIFAVPYGMVPVSMSLSFSALLEYFMDFKGIGLKKYQSKGM